MSKRLPDQWDGPRCDNGCDPNFLQFVCWKGANLRILQNWSKPGSWGGPRWWKGMLLCGSCGDELIVLEMTNKQKIELEEVVEAGMEEMRDMQQHYDRENDLRHAEFDAYLRETGRA